MSDELLKTFLSTIREDIGLQEKLKAALDVDDVLAIAKDAGFVLSLEDLKKAQAEVSEDELEGMAGGRYRNTRDDHSLCGGYMC